MNLDIRDVGTAEFNSVTRLFASSIGKTLADFSAKVQSDPATVQFILKALQQPLDYDMRNGKIYS